jgi:hypothetical protein
MVPVFYILEYTVVTVCALMHIKKVFEHLFDIGRFRMEIYIGNVSMTVETWQLAVDGNVQYRCVWLRLFLTKYSLL